MTYPLVSELADDGIPVTVSCRVLKLARQPYYRWRNDPVRDADVLRAYRINALHDAHHEVMDALGEMLWQAQRSGRPPDGAAYVDAVQRRATRD